MRASGIFGLLGVVVAALVVADLWTHSAVTDKLIGASTTDARLVAGK